MTPSLNKIWSRSGSPHSGPSEALAKRLDGDPELRQSLIKQVSEQEIRLNTRVFILFESNALQNVVRSIPIRDWVEVARIYAVDEKDIKKGEGDFLSLDLVFPVTIAVWHDGKEDFISQVMTLRESRR